jgi:hypothetical protein
MGCEMSALVKVAKCNRSLVGAANGRIGSA